MKNILPDENRLNKRKIGFNAPIVDWFRGELKEWMLDQMNHSEFTQNIYFDYKQLKNHFLKFLEKPNPQWGDAWKFWRPVHIAWWMRNNLKN